MQDISSAITFVFVLILDKTVFSTSDVDSNLSGLRLPRNLKPNLYTLEIRPYLDTTNNFTFQGKITIAFDCLEDTEQIVLNSKNLTIFEDRVNLIEEREKNPVEIREQSYDLKKDFYIIHTDMLTAGESYQVTIEFMGALGTKLTGFYRCNYKDIKTGEVRWLAVTQFEPIYARQSFPCFDEPDFKAKFDISITHLKNMTSLSNMPLKSTIDAPEEGWVTDSFERTVLMSTYLVAFIVFDFGHKDSPDGKFRIWARKDMLNETKYALRIGPEIQKYYEEYFNLPFPLPKQDLVAIPDFYHGAMENFGLITFRENGLIFNPHKTSDTAKDYITETVSHELSHQWFGNLVTMKWFNDLWLNEGFASFVEYLGVDKVEPSWHKMQDFVTIELHIVFDFDAWNSSHPVSVDVENPDDINELFDTISYKKGASIIRMITNFLTDATMRAGLSLYLNKWKFNNTVEDDLWDALTHQAHKDKTLGNVTVKEICDTWTKQKGFPLVNVKRSYDSKRVTFSQKQFIFSKILPDEEPRTWWIPISYSTPKHDPEFNKTQPKFWLTDKDKSLEVEINIKPDQWLIVNVQQTGIYRVNYDNQNWNLIKLQLIKDFKAIHIVNRAQIINDVFNLARNSLIPYDLAFDVTNYIRNDDEHIPWKSYIAATDFIKSILSTSPVFGKFQEYMRHQFEIQYELFGFEGKEGADRHQRLHRINVITSACNYGIEKCVDFAKEKFAVWMNSSNPDVENPIQKNFRTSVYCTGLKYGGEKEWDFLWKRFHNATSVSDKSTVLTALACSREPWLLNRFIKLTIIPELEGGLGQKDVSSVLALVAKKVFGFKLVMQFLDDYWEPLSERLGKSGLEQLKNVLQAISSHLTTPSELKQFEVFKERDFGPATLAVNQGIERIKTNILWMETHYLNISKWLTMIMNQNVNT